jgi:molybdopterin molybdotransferase
MISAEEAIGLVLSHARPRAPERLTLAGARGLVLAEAVVADRDFPPFDRATMDGFAVRLVHAGRTVAIRGESRPGVAPSAAPDDDACVEIMTGAPCPAGTEAVVMKEEVSREDGRATFPPRILPGQHIVPRGAERRQGSVVVPAGARVTPIAVALLASVGQSAISARSLPRVAVLVTGDELVGVERAPGDVEVRDSNGPMLSAMLASAGVTVSDVRSVKDTPEALAAALDAVASADVVVLTGGVSAGNYDLVPAALVAHGASVVFHKVRQQPGKPILFAVAGPRLFFGLPGTPLGCHLGMERYVLPAVRALAGLPPARPTERGRLTGPWASPSERQQFVLAHVSRESDEWRVSPLSPRGSSDLFAVWAANAYMLVAEGTRDLPSLAEVPFAWLASVPA